MSRITGDPRQALIDLGPSAPFAEKAAIAICGPDLVDIDYYSLLVATGRLEKMNPDCSREIQPEDIDRHEQIAGKILIDFSKDKDRINKLLNALDLVVSVYHKNPKIKWDQAWRNNYSAAIKKMMNLPQNAAAYIPPSVDCWDSIITAMETTENIDDEIISSFSTKILGMTLRQDMQIIMHEIFEKIELVKLYIDQAILPLEACILLAVRKVDLRKAQQVIQNKKAIYKSGEIPLSDRGILADIGLPFPEFDSKGSEFWRFKRLFLSEWEEMTEPVLTTKTGMRNYIKRLTGHEPSLKDVETSAEIVGVNIKTD
jgi:hypothetical protein